MDYYRAIGPLLRLAPAEAAHALTLWALRRGLVPAGRAEDDPVLACRLWGRDFSTPIGLAAGFDKHAEVPDAMLALGFGFAQAGAARSAMQGIGRASQRTRGADLPHRRPG